MAKTPFAAALYREVIPANDGARTVRVTAYPRREDQQTGVIFGIGYANPENFAKINFEVTPELWLQITVAVEAAFEASDKRAQETLQHANPVPSTTQPRPRRQRAPQAPQNPSQSTVMPPPQPGQPARRHPKARPTPNPGSST